MTEPVMVGGGPAAPGNKRVLIMLGVAAVMAVLALVLPKLLFAGGDDAAAEAEVLPVGAPVTGAPATPAPLQEVAAEPARTFEVFSTKNPFTPLIDTTPAAASTPAPAGVAPAAVAPAPVTVTPVAGAPVAGAPVAAVPGTTPAPAAVAPVDAVAAPAVGGGTEPRSGQRVALLEVFADETGTTVATVRVNDTVHEVAEGAAFATSYKVVTLSVADGCGQFLYGDDRFRLCEGEELLK